MKCRVLWIVTIVYYCCQTAYVSNESGEYAGLNMDAIGMITEIFRMSGRVSKPNENSPHSPPSESQRKTVGTLHSVFVRTEENS